MQVKDIVKLTVDELFDAGRIKYDNNMAYQFITGKLSSYFTEGGNDKIDTALCKIRDDEYFEILQLYFHEGHTIEEIAEILDRDMRTISRNKKRLCLKVYEEAYKDVPL